MRFRVHVTRVQSTERVFNAADEESAIRKVEGELERPYGILGPWTTQDFESEIVSVDNPLTFLTVCR